MSYYPCKKNEPTVVPAKNMDAKKDAEAIYGTSRGEDLINILCYRANVQRLEIAKAYKTLYGEDLIADLKGKTSGNFEKVLVALTTPLPHFYAQELHDAMDGVGTDESVLIETLTTLGNFGVRSVSKSYKELFGRTLEEDIMSDTSGHFRKLCVALAQGNRDEDSTVSIKAAKEDAQKLLEAGVEKWGTDESVFNSILVSRSFEHLEQVFSEYHAMAEHPMDEAIKKEFSGDVQNGLLAIVKCVRSKTGYLAERLHWSMKGLGTNDKTLIRIVVARSEIDLGNIRREFNAMYGSSLAEWIRDDTSGDYRKALLAIVGEE